MAKTAKDLSTTEKLTELVNATKDMAGIITGSTEEELTDLVSGAGV